MRKESQNGFEWGTNLFVMLRLFVAITPLVGAIVFPIAILTTMSRFGIAPGVLIALVFSTLWFAAMLRTSEMPH